VIFCGEEIAVSISQLSTQDSARFGSHTVQVDHQLAEIRLPQIMKRMSTLEQHISPDSWIKIFSYLLASDAIRLTSCSKYLHEKVGENEFVWRELLTWGDAQLLRQVVNQSLSFKQLDAKAVHELKSVDETPKASSSSSR
jgi:hypothetical protein